MTYEQINEAIAEACGWKWERIWTGELQGKPIGEQGPLRPIPDYCTDLNAMHEAEKVLMNDWKKQKRYLEWLGWEDDSMKTIITISRSTARDRAEAFLWALGKWEEVQG